VSVKFMVYFMVSVSCKYLNIHNIAHRRGYYYEALQGGNDNGGSLLMDK